MLVLLSFSTWLAQLCVVAAHSHFAPSHVHSPTVQLGHTTLVGRNVSLLKQDFFGGIPFVEPPVGKLRLENPVLKKTLAPGTFNATNFGASCLSLDLPLSQMSEDCLTINVFRPSHISKHEKLPVLFWVYGGGFVNGSATFYNGSGIVAQSVARGTPVIYVNFNYRLGPLGFPQGQEAIDKKVLNLGLKDIIAALEWMQLNIGAFGGDKDKVTIFGQSAGSVLISLLYLNYPIEHLVRAAILESGAQASGPIMTGLDRDDDWLNFAAGTKSCGSKVKVGSAFNCLQAASSDDIFNGLNATMVKTKNMFTWEATIDGPGGLIPDIPSVLFKQGKKFARIPFITGTNQDEGTVFAAAFISMAVNSTQQIKNFVTGFSSPPSSLQAMDSSIDELMLKYPNIPALGSPFNTGNDTFGLNSEWKRAAAVVGDLMFHSQRRFWLNTAAEAGVKTWGYLFTQPTVGAPPALGVSHGSEIPFVYGAPNPSLCASLLSRVMVDYWVSFATSLDPNDGLGTPRPTWDQFTPKNKFLMQLNSDNTSMIPDIYRQDQIAFIDSNPTVWRQ